MKKSIFIVAIVVSLIIGFGNNYNKTFAAEVRKNSLTITREPKYIIMDPNNGTPTFVDDQGNNPEISGNWSSSSTGNLQEFVTEIGKKENPSSNWQWYAGIDDESILKNNNLSNNFSNISLLSALNKTKGEANSYKLTELEISQEYVLFEGIKNSDGTWTYSSNQAIPFYIKAPKVILTNAIEDMLKTQKITGKGQAGDTVTIKDGDKTWTGTVNSDGNFTIDTKGGLKALDNISIAEVNGTGDKSASDPVNIEISVPNKGQTPVSLDVNSMNLPSNPDGKKPTGPDDTNPHIIPPGTKFGLLFTPSNFNFGTLNNFSQGDTIKQTLSSDQSIGVGDVRSGSPGWQLTAKASDLSNNGNNLAGTISMNTSVKHVSYDGTKYSLDSTIPGYAKAQTPTANGQVTLNIGGDAAKIMSASQGKGTGLWAADMSSVTLNSTNTGNVISGTYQGTITWNLSDTPPSA